MNQPVMNIIASKNYIWNITEIEMLRHIAKRCKYDFVVYYSASDIPEVRKNIQGSKYAIVLGTNHAWLEKNIAELQAKKIIPVMIGDLVWDNKNISCLRMSQKDIINDGVEYLKGKGKEKTALFGIIDYDANDLTKVHAFLNNNKSGNDIYTYSKNLDECFNSFFKNIDNYDSVICCNDIITTYLIKECKKQGVILTDRLEVVSNGFTTISYYTIYPFITYVYDTEERDNIIMNALKFLYRTAGISTLNIEFDISCVKRIKNTEISSEKASEYLQSKFIDNYSSDSPLASIYRINNTLGRCDALDLKIISLQLEGYSYQDTAEQLYISIETMKSRLRRLYKGLGIHKRSELVDIFNEHSLKIG